MKSIKMEFQGFLGIRSCFDKSVRSVAHRFGMGTDGTRLAVVF